MIREWTNGKRRNSANFIETSCPGGLISLVLVAPYIYLNTHFGVDFYETIFVYNYGLDIGHL